MAATACAATPPQTARSARAPANPVVTTELPNGRVEITIAPSYPRGVTVTIPVTIVVTRGTVTGPLAARVVASGINDTGTPAEVLVRELAVTPATVGRTPSARTTLTWDTRDAKGVIVPADAYVLLLEVRSDDGGTSRALVASATLEVR